MSTGRAGAEVFGRAAPTYDTVVPFFATFGARLVELADLRPGERVLDVGCGRGAALLPAARRLARAGSGSVVGADLSAGMVSLLAADLSEERIGNASVALMDAEELAVAGGAFDVVLAAFLLHLVPDPDACAAELYRATRPGGRCVAMVPPAAGEAWSWSHGMRALFEVLPPDVLEELRQATFAELARLRTEAGIPLGHAARFVVATR